MLAPAATPPPATARYVVVGAGIHGLSTAWQLARELRASGRGSGTDVVVLDKAAPGAGASGIACGVIRNNYFQPAMRRLMAHSVAIWEAHADVLAYHPVGYLQASPEAMHEGVAQIHAEQREIGYPSRFVEGETGCRNYLQELFGDWQGRGITSVLHEQRGGFANNLAAVHGLAAMAVAEGVALHSGVRVIGLDRAGGAVRAVQTDRGSVECEQVVLAAGPWLPELWSMLELPAVVTVGAASDLGAEQRPMWSYWLVQEGTLRVDPDVLTDNRGCSPPVMHVDSDAPLLDESGELVTDQPWGIYYKPDKHFGGVQGGSMPRRIELAAADVRVDPYGPEQSEYVSGKDFARLWTAALAHCHQRFEGTAERYDPAPSGGIGCFTPDSFPVFDTFRDNAFVIADSNHGYKMIGVGALVAKELLGERQELLEPFRFARYDRGALHPTSNSPFPWS